MLFSLIPSRAVIAQSVHRWAMGWSMEVLGYDSRLGLGIFLFTTASRTALGPTKPPIQWVPGALSLGVKRPGREADYSPPSTAEVKNAWSYTSTPQYVFMAWCLVKQRDNFTFTFFQVTASHETFPSKFCVRHISCLSARSTYPAHRSPPDATILPKLGDLYKS
jgi:hypothetical protein